MVTQRVYYYHRPPLCRVKVKKKHFNTLDMSTDQLTSNLLSLRCHFNVIKLLLECQLHKLTLLIECNSTATWSVTRMSLECHSTVTYLTTLTLPLVHLSLACYWTATRLPLDCQLSSFLKHKYALNIGKNVDTKGVLLP